MGSVQKHLNVSLIVHCKVTRQCPSTTICEEKGEPKRESNRGPSAYLHSALPPGQARSPVAFPHSKASYRTESHCLAYSALNVKWIPTWLCFFPAQTLFRSTHQVSNFTNGEIKQLFCLLIISQTRSLRRRELFNCDLQQWHSCFIICLSVCRFVK